MTSTDLDAFIADETAASDEKDREIMRLRGKVADERRAKQAALRDLEISDRRLELIAGLADREPPAPISLRGDSAKAQATAVLCCSDWHVGELVDPGQVAGLNEYNPAIAKKRLERLAVGTGWVLDALAGGWQIRDLVLWLGGDIITGYLHDDQRESNSMSPTEEMLFARERIIGIIRYLLDRSIERIVVPCSFGNHGRTTHRPRCSTAAKNSYEWLLYQMLALEFAADPRVDFEVASGAHLYTEVYGRTIRWHHGDAVRYQGGVGGVTIPLNKAIARWDDARQADYTVIGHFHQLTDLGHAVVNGSAIGYGAYSLQIGASPETPAQAFFLIDERWGKRLLTPIYLEDPNE